MPTVTDNLAQLYQHIQELSTSHKSMPCLIAVSKTYPVPTILEAYNHNQRNFGENYVQELIAKAELLAHLADIEWHFIGTIQSNKIRHIARYASWVHTLTKSEHALRLNRQRTSQQPRLQVLIEVNISSEDSKSGLTTYQQIRELASQIVQLPKLQLRGLMGMASNTNDSSIIKSQFDQLATYLAKLNHDGYQLDQLSMGMSNDYPLAIEAGSTMIRIGNKIFGERSYAN